jgi:hypothetical protein
MPQRQPSEDEVVESQAEVERRIRRVYAVGADDGEGACRYCGKPFERDELERPMHEWPVTDCPGPPQRDAPSVLYSLPSEKELDIKPVRRPRHERDDDD